MGLGYEKYIKFVLRASEGLLKGFREYLCSE